MKKENYKQILHTMKSAETLDVIIDIALDDDELSIDDFRELINERYAIIM